MTKDDDLRHLAWAMKFALSDLVGAIAKREISPQYTGIDPEITAALKAGEAFLAWAARYDDPDDTDEEIEATVQRYWDRK